MMMTMTLPILMAMSWVPAERSADAPQQPIPREFQQTPEAAKMIECPITGETIPACCCPVGA